MRTLVLVSALALAACGDADAPSPDAAPAAASGVLAPETLLARFPADASGLPKAAESGATDGALGYEVARATATYTNNINVPGPNVVLNVLDLGNATMAGQMGFGWGLDGGTPDTTIAGFPAFIQPLTPGGATGVSVLVGERFFVEAKGAAVPMAATEKAVVDLDLPALAALAGE